LYATRNIISGIKPTNEQVRNAYGVLIGKLEGKRPLGRHTRTREDNIKMDITEIGWEVLEMIHLVQYRDYGRLL
jgi:hypothetical protein